MLIHALVFKIVLKKARSGLTLIQKEATYFICRGRSFTCARSFTEPSLQFM